MAFVDKKIGKVGSLLEMAAGNLAAEKGYITEEQRVVRERIRNMSNDQLIALIERYDPRFAAVIREEVRRYGKLTNSNGTELGQLKLILQRLQTMDTGGSLLETLRVMAIIAILQQIIRNVQGLIG